MSEYPDIIRILKYGIVKAYTFKFLISVIQITEALSHIRYSFTTVMCIRSQIIYRFFQL